jgi:hypothetical protein
LQQRRLFLNYDFLPNAVVERYDINPAQQLYPRFPGGDDRLQLVQHAIRGIDADDAAGFRCSDV